MKKIKRVFAVLLAVTLMLAMGTTALADTESEPGNNGGTSGTITIQNAAANQTYKIYQMFTLESYSNDIGDDGTVSNAAYAYTIDSSSPWYGFVKSADGEADAGAGAEYVTLELKTEGEGENAVSTYYVTWNKKDNSGNPIGAADFAKEALKYAADHNITASKTASTNDGADNGEGVSVTPNTDDNGVATGDYTITFSGLNLGYYLLDSSMGTLCSLDTTNPTVNIEEKNEEPTNEKKVLEETTYGSTNDASIGDTVYFQSIITAQEGAANYVFHDKMSNGLTFTSNSVAVYRLDNKNGSYYLVDGIFTDVRPENYTGDKYSLVVNSNYTFKDYTASGTTTSDDCTFEVVFTQDFCDTLTDGDTLVISYSATLNENAIIADAGNTNTSKLTYGDDSNTSTTPSTTTTYTWSVEVFKYADTDTPLAGAKFKLVKADASGGYNKNDDALYFVSQASNQTAMYHLTGSNTTGAVQEITTDATGRFILQGLDSGTYYLVETEAPKGYNKLAGPVKIVINSKNQNTNAVTGTATVTYYNYDAAEKDYDSNGTNITNTANQVKVLNKTGTLLPSTGGMGTTIFYVIGGILVIVAAVLLIVRRRMNSEK